MFCIVLLCALAVVGVGRAEVASVGVGGVVGSLFSGSGASSELKARVADKIDHLDIDDWSPRDVGDWLEANGLSEFRDEFEELRVDGDMLFDLERQEVEQYLKMKDATTRKRFFEAVRTLRHEVVDEARPTNSSFWEWRALHREFVWKALPGLALAPRSLVLLLVLNDPTSMRVLRESVFNETAVVGGEEEIPRGMAAFVGLSLVAPHVLFMRFVGGWFDTDPYLVAIAQVFLVTCFLADTVSVLMLLTPSDRMLHVDDYSLLGLLPLQLSFVEQSGIGIALMYIAGQFYDYLPWQLIDFIFYCEMILLLGVMLFTLYSAQLSLLHVFVAAVSDTHEEVKKAWSIENRAAQAAPLSCTCCSRTSRLRAAVRTCIERSTPAPPSLPPTSPFHSPLAKRPGSTPLEIDIPQQKQSLTRSHTDPPKKRRNRSNSRVRFSSKK